MSDDYSRASSMSDDESLASEDSFNDFSKKRFHCEECEGTFATRYNLVRHNANFHDEGGEDSMSDTDDEEETDDDEDEEDDEMSIDDEEETDDDDEDEEGEQDGVTDMFRNLVRKAINKHEDQLLPDVESYMIEKGMSEKEATKRAFLGNNEAKKTFHRKYIQNIFDIEEQRRDPLFKAIMKKAKEFMDDDGLDQSEAIAAAVKFRKQAIYNMINYIWET